MGMTTIEWTSTYKDGELIDGYTWNPWMGCTKVSPACAHCYAEAMMDERYGKVQWGVGKPRKRTKPPTWKLPHQWDRKAARDGTNPAVFSLSLGDWLDAEAPSEWLADMLAVVSSTPNLRWLLLTKRPENYWDRVGLARLPDNVAVGVTVENQRAAEQRLPLLAKIPAAMRFVSAEPLLEPLDLGNVEGSTAIDWLICGGESGRSPRPFDLANARKLADWCEARSVPFFLKQLGCNWLDSSNPAAGGYIGRSKNGDIENFPTELQFRQLPSFLGGASR